MTLFNNKYRVESTRLKGWYYTSSGLYFITINTYKMKVFFGNVLNGEMILNEAGKIVDEEWKKTCELRNNVILDEYQVMPNHFHGIIALTKKSSHSIPETPQRGVYTGEKILPMSCIHNMNKQAFSPEGAKDISDGQSPRKEIRNLS